MSLKHLLNWTISLFLIACQAPSKPPEEPLADEWAPRPLAQRGASDENENLRGLISASTLSRWLTDWKAHRPAGIDGELIILQRSPASVPAFLASSEGVRVYHAVEIPMLLQSRSNGVLAIGQTAARGVRVDSFLRRYRIDFTKDFVLFALGQADASGLEEVAAAYLTFRYFGAEDAHLGVLNGAVEGQVADTLRSEEALAAPIDGAFRMPSLKRNQLSVVATLEDVHTAVKTSAPLVDVRSLDEYEGRTVSSSETEDTCLEGAPNCTSVFAGHIQGAQRLDLDAWLDVTQSKLKPLPELEAVLERAGFSDSLQPLIIYSADERKGAVATFAALAVIGIEARWYASGFLEWGTLNASHPNPALRNLPEDSRWRTDLLIEAKQALSDAQTAARPLILAPRAASASAQKEEDLAYLKEPPPLPAPGAGDSDCVD